MNTYGKFAQEAWRTTAPEEYALIPDPEAWFERLGEEATQRVGDLMMELAGPDRQGETYLEKVGRLNASKMQAEEIVLVFDIGGGTSDISILRLSPDRARRPDQVRWHRSGREVVQPGAPEESLMVTRTR